MTRRAILLTLLLLNLAGQLGGSVATPTASHEPAWAAMGAGQAAIDRLSLQRIDPAGIDRLLRDARDSTLQEYARDVHGLSTDDLALLDRGAMLVPRSLDIEAMSPAELIAAVGSTRADLSSELLRANQAVGTAVEARAMQLYVEGVHEGLEASFEQALELSLKNLRDQLSVIQQYYRKFPSVAVACT